MADRPILFSAPMVRAILAGTKTQTRRAIKPLPLRVNHGTNEMEVDTEAMTDGRIMKLNRFGQPGDRLWVRETFYCDHCFYPEGTPPSCYWDGPNPRAAHTPEQLAKERSDMLEAMYYRADGEPEFEAPEGPTPWRPSIHMPRWASRITLEVTGVRVERLQDISEADAIAEGVNVHPDHHGKPRANICSPVQAYRDLWESINGQGSWAVNPWVWVISFHRLEANAC